MPNLKTVFVLVSASEGLNTKDMVENYENHLIQNNELLRTSDSDPNPNPDPEGGKSAQKEEKLV
jgi:hypothetical protein